MALLPSSGIYGQGTQTGTGTSSKSYTNLQKYIDANRGQGQRLAQQITNPFKQQAQTIKQNIDTGLANPIEAQKQQQDYRGQVGQFEESSQAQLGNEGFRMQALKNLSRPTSSFGESTLNNLLLGQQGARRELEAAPLQLNSYLENQGKQAQQNVYNDIQGYVPEVNKAFDTKRQDTINRAARIYDDDYTSYLRSITDPSNSNYKGYYVPKANQQDAMYRIMNDLGQGDFYTGIDPVRQEDKSRISALQALTGASAYGALPSQYAPTFQEGQLGHLANQPSNRDQWDERVTEQFVPRQYVAQTYTPSSDKSAASQRAEAGRKAAFEQAEKQRKIDFDRSEIERRKQMDTANYNKRRNIEAYLKGHGLEFSDLVY